MKKFYVPIVTVVFLLTAFISRGQVYNSITSNPGHLTLDDPNFWVGGAGNQPDNPCNNCTINIYADSYMVQEGSSSFSFNNCGAPCAAFLNHIIINNSTINVYGNTTFTVDTYLTLDNTSITLGNDPTSTQIIKLNDQVDLQNGASIVLANNLTSVNANDIGAVPVLAGPHEDIGNPGFKSPGLFAIIPVDVNGYDYSWTLSQNGLGKSTAPYLPSPDGGITHYNYYILNCDPIVFPSPNTCGDGFVFGPAKTSLDATFGLIFIQNFTLPVQLVQFLANKAEDGSVKLSWATAQEQNSASFDVERSGDQAAWSSIGSVKAKGYASTTTNYSLSDKFPLDGTAYYRLKMIDLDGKFKYSKTVSVSGAKDTRALVIYSNPFNDVIRMKVNVSRAQNLTLTVSDMVGKTLISTSQQVHIGENFIDLHPHSISGGMYILHVHGDSYDQTVKLEKQ